MDYGRTDQIQRDVFHLQRTHSNHITGRREAAVGGASGDFEQRLFSALNGVNNDQQEHEQLALQAVINPDGVDVHDVTVAAARADLSLRITKNVVDRVISAYREITGLR